MIAPTITIRRTQFAGNVDLPDLPGGSLHNEHSRQEIELDRLLGQ